MRVALLNLGESPRIFYNRLNKPVSVPVGKITVADLDGRIVEGLRNPSTPETILVGDEDMKIPDEVVGIIELLAVVEFESYERLLARFLKIAPPNNLGPAMRPSRQQIRQMLRTMVEDWIAAKRDGQQVPIHDDKNPEQLKELEEAERNRQDPNPPHPIAEQRKHRAAGGEGTIYREAPQFLPPEKTPLEDAARASAARKAAKKGKQKRRA